jgi:hypothetical protein
MIVSGRGPPSLRKIPACRPRRPYINIIDQPATIMLKAASELGLPRVAAACSWQAVNAETELQREASETRDERRTSINEFLLRLQSGRP